MADESNENLDTENPESVFPLPLTPIEKFFFWDDRPEQPLTSFFHLSFESTLDVDLLESCICKVVERNPLLRAHVSGKDDDLKWILSDKPFRLLSLKDDPPVLNGMVRPIDLRTEVGCRFWCESAPDCSRIVAQLHHSACDGIAFRSVCIDILHLYALATCGGSESSQNRSLFYERFKYAQLRERHSFEHLGKPKRETTTWQRIKNAWYFHFQPPTPLAKNLAAENKKLDSTETNGSLCNLLMDREFSQRIFRACQTKACGVNDAAIAILFTTCYQWNRKNGDTRQNGRLRILMPYDLRGRTDIRMPATNRLSLSFLGREYSQCGNVDELISSIQTELKDVKDTHLYLDLLNGIELACRWPKFMRWALRKHDSMATAAITYTGDLSRGMNKLFPEENQRLRVGSALLFSTMGAPPARRNTNVSLALCINWGMICISATWNHEVFSDKDCSDFLELYKMGWQQWCESEELRASMYAESESAKQNQIGPK